MKAMLLLLSAVILAASAATIKPTTTWQPYGNLKEISSLLARPNMGLPKLPYTENLLPVGTGLNRCQDLFFCKAEQILKQMKHEKMDGAARNVTVKVTRNLALFNKSEYKCTAELPKFRSSGEQMEFSKFMDALRSCCEYRLIKDDVNAA